MADPAAARLAREASVFGRLLAGEEPPPEAVAAYARACAVDPRLSAAGAAPRELALLALARRGPRRARAADAYARLFAPRALLRKRLVCLLAVLECGAATAERLDRPDAGPAGLLLRLAGQAALLPLRAALAAALLPLERGAASPPGRGEERA